MAHFMMNKQQINERHPNFQPYRTAYAPSDRNILNTVENFANLKIANTHFNLDKNRPIATIIPHNPYFSYSSPLSH